jgi:hypothetical protein
VLLSLFVNHLKKCAKSEKIDIFGAILAVVEASGVQQDIRAAIAGPSFRRSLSLAARPCRIATLFETASLWGASL